MFRNTAVLAAMAAFSSVAGAQGAFDFTRIPGISVEPTVQIDLNPMMLGFVTEAARATDPASAAMLDDIRGVKVLVYELESDNQPVLDFIDDTSGALEGEGWQRAVYVQEDDEKVRVYMKFDDTQMAGLVVMVVDSSEAVFVNIDGAIDPASLGRIAGSLGMGEVLGSISGGAAVPSSSCVGVACRTPEAPEPAPEQGEPE